MRLLYNILFLIGCTALISCAPSLADMYGNEISNLKSQEEVDAYWKELDRIDQDILLNEEDVAVYDSISISNMIRVVLLFETPGKESYLQKQATPVVTLSHNFNKDAGIAYWPVIVKCAEMKGVIHQIGYPSYPLESIAGTLYNYSLFEQEERYPDLVEKLNAISGGYVISQLEMVFNKEKKLRQLTEKNSIGTWFVETIKNQKSEQIFEFVIMSDNALYKRSGGRIQKLIEIESNIQSETYKIENDPFDWYYTLSKQGDLVLYDQHDNELIKYTKS